MPQNMTIRYLLEAVEVPHSRVSVLVAAHVDPHAHVVTGVAFLSFELGGLILENVHGWVYRCEIVLVILAIENT